jgi:hypothetical protein
VSITLAPWDGGRMVHGDMGSFDTRPERLTEPARISTAI